MCLVVVGTLASDPYAGMAWMHMRIVAGLLTITIGAAIVLFHFVEEPARRWMRRMVDVRGPNTDARTDPAAHAAAGKLQSVDRALEARSKSISARAG